LSVSRKYVARAERNPDATPEHVRRKAPEVVEFTARTVQRALELGVPIAMGTDAGMFGHGDNAWELELLVEVGLTPMQALVATTATAAACIGLGDQVGTLQRGERAGGGRGGKWAARWVAAGARLKDGGVRRDGARLALIMRDGRPPRTRLPAVAAQPLRAARVARGS